MVKYLCITCLHVETDRVSFKTVDDIKPVLELFVPEIKNTSANGLSPLVCEQCFFFVKTVEQFRKRCAQSQEKISALNIEKNCSPTKASTGQVDSNSASARPNIRRRSGSERTGQKKFRCDYRSHGPVEEALNSAKKARKQSNEEESAASVQTDNDDSDHDDYYITRQDLVSAGILPEIIGSASVDAKTQASEAEEAVEVTPNLKASPNNPKAKCNACSSRCSRQQGKPVRCDYCNFFSMEKASLLKHFDTCHQELATPISLLTCQECSFECASLIQLSIHRVKQHEEPANCALRDQGPNSTSGKLGIEENYCCECVTIFLTVEDYHEHMVKKHKRADCSCCQRLFPL